MEIRTIANIVTREETLYDALRAYVVECDGPLTQKSNGWLDTFGDEYHKEPYVVDKTDKLDFGYAPALKLAKALHTATERDLNLVHSYVLWMIHSYHHHDDGLERGDYVTKKMERAREAVMSFSHILIYIIF